MSTLLLNEPSAPSIVKTAPSVLQDIHTILTGWYTRGAVTISIDLVPAFGTADQCIEILEQSRLGEIQRVHRLLVGNREKKGIVEHKCPD